jgi:Family of unknown function (DUF5906)/Primase C terminal 2 (PriCT-2)
MTPLDAQPLINALKPILIRVRTDVTAVKSAKGAVAWTREPLTKTLMQKHLIGGPARGVSPIKAGQSVTMLAVLDLDSHKGLTTWDEMIEVTQKVCDALRADLMEPITFRSSGGSGIHIYVLWDEPQDAYSVRMALKSALISAGYKDGAKGVSEGEIEVFPKQDSVPIDGFGNQFFIPMAGKSEPIDMIFGDTTGIPGLLSMEWPSSMPVPVLEKAVADKFHSGTGAVSIHALRSALTYIVNDGSDESPDYFKWRDRMFAIHEGTGGSEEGFQLLLEFSENNPRHDPKEARRLWGDVKLRPDGITHLSILADARAKGWQEAHELDFEDEDGNVPQLTYEEIGAYVRAKPLPELADDIFAKSEEQKKQARYDARRKWKEVIEAADDDFRLRENICPQIAKDHALGVDERMQLADLLFVRFKTLGAKLPIASCRKLIEQRKPRKQAEDITRPAWAKDWVYVTDEDQFYRTDSEEWLSMQGFRAKFNRLSIGDQDGNVDAARDALDNLEIPTVTRPLYLPWAGPMFDHDGVACVNTYRPSSVPLPADKITPRGQLAIDAVKRHMGLLFNGRSEVVETIMSWIAHNVQKPGIKIRWAPLIKGVQGDGKTLLGTLVTSVMGQANVKNVSPHALASTFTSWAEGSCVAVLEEVRIIGHNRYDIFNALKPYITNDMVPIVGKGSNEKGSCVNVTNYMGFTNFNDALPMDDGDRRWMVIFSPFADIAELAAAVGGDSEAYFNSLFELITSQRADLRRFFLDYPIAASFRPNGKAPHTEEREMMIGMSMSDDEAALRHVLSAGGFGIGQRVLASSYVSAALAASGSETIFQTSALSKALTKMGWAKVPERLRWRDKTETIWLRGFVVSGELRTRKLREELDATAIGQEVDLFAGLDLQSNL